MRVKPRERMRGNWGLPRRNGSPKHRTERIDRIGADGMAPAGVVLLPGGRHRFEPDRRIGIPADPIDDHADLPLRQPAIL